MYKLNAIYFIVSFISPHDFIVETTRQTETKSKQNLCFAGICMVLAVLHAGTTESQSTVPFRFRFLVGLDVDLLALILSIDNYNDYGQCFAYFPMKTEFLRWGTFSSWTGHECVWIR